LPSRARILLYAYVELHCPSMTFRASPFSITASQIAISDVSSGLPWRRIPTIESSRNSAEYAYCQVLGWMAGLHKAPL